jgi:hypothetical protein
MVQWTVTMARNIPPAKLARVSSYDVLGTVMAMPAGALIAGPLGAAIGTSRAEYAAAGRHRPGRRAGPHPAGHPHDSQRADADRLHGAAAAGTVEAAERPAAGPGQGPPSSGRTQTFLEYERNVSTDTATHATASTSSPPQRTPIAPQSGAVETAERPI